MKDRHKKEKKSTRKHHRILWVFAFFLVVGIGVTAYILLFSAYTRWVERETTATGTVQEEIYSFKDLTLQKHRFSERKTLPPSVLP